MISKHGVFYIIDLKLMFLCLLFAAYRVIRLYLSLRDLTGHTVTEIGIFASATNSLVIFLKASGFAV